MNEKLVFIHIPKAGGNTLHDVIKRNYNEVECYHTHQYGVSYKEEVKQFKESSKEKRDDLKYIRGHIGFGLHNVLGDSSYVTMLRDPVDRVISHYYYILYNRRDTDLYRQIKDKTLEEFVKSDSRSNLQTRFLAAKDGLPIMEADNKELSGKHLKRAKYHLKDHFSFVGLLNKFDTSLLLLKEILGLDNVCYIRKNKTRKRKRKDEISSTIRKVVLENNRLDMELYKYAENLFEKQVKNYSKDIEQELEKFRARQKEYREDYTSDYRKSGREKLNFLNNLFNKAGKDEIVVFGAGEHTLRLLEDTNITKKKIKYIIDSYKAGVNFRGFKVKKPEYIKEDKPDIIVISSFTFQEQMYSYLDDLSYDGQIIKIYDKNDDTPFYV
jgi:hypothetical protein